MVETTEEADQKIIFARRTRNGHANGATSAALSVVINHIDEIARHHSR